MRPRRLLPLAIFALWSAILLGGVSLFAQNRTAQRGPALSLSEIQRIAVPEDDPKNWPFRDQEWTPFNRDDYLRRLSRLVTPVETPDRPAWRRVRYVAVLTGDSLTSGRLTAELQKLENRPRFLSLENPSLAIEELSWSEGPAVWGTGLDGKHWLRLESRSDPLEGRWSARGRPLETGVAFDLDLLSAAISELELQAPTGQVVTTDVGDVELADSGASPEWQTWRISLGNHSRCRLIVSQPVRSGATIPTMLYEQEQAVIVSQEELQVTQTFLVELLAGDVSRFTVSMPRSVEIVSATSGDQLPLTFERIPGEGPSSHIVVTLPDETPGRRSFRLDGYVRRAPGEQFAVPQFVLEGGLWMKGRVNVTIGRPMELRSYRAPGYRQTVPVSKPSDGEMVSFQQILPRAQLLLNVDRPNSERSAHVINQLAVGPRQWTLTAEIAWQSRSGTVFDAACRIPDGWRVHSVVRLGGGRESQETTDWKLEPHTNSGQVLTLEFPDGLTPGRVDSVRIVAQRDVMSSREPTTVPFITPVDCDVSEVLLQIDRPSMQQLALTSGDQFEPFDIQSAATVWNTLPAWSSVSDDSGDQAVLHVIHPESSVPLSNLRTASTGGVAVDLAVTLRDTQIHEQYAVRLDDLADDERALELMFAESTPGIRWAAEADPELELAIQRRPATTGKADERGEVYVITLPNRDGDQVRLIGTRELAWTDDYAVPVATAPRARRFTGRVRLSVESTKAYVLSKQNAADSSREPGIASNSDAPISEPIEWAYHDAGAVWRVRPRDRSSTQTVPWSYRLKTVLTGERHGYDYHELRLRPTISIESKGLSFRLSPKAEFLAAWSNEHTLDVNYDGDAWTLIGGGLLSDRNELVLTYRTSTEAVLSRSQHHFEVPQLPGTCTSLSWQISVPNTVEFRSPPLGLAMTPAPVRSDWWQRLRGPLSRSPEDAKVRQAGALSVTATGSDSKTGRWSFSLPDSARLYQLSSPELPREADFIAWDTATSRLTTWMCLVGCLPAGWLLRRLSGVWRHQLLSVLIGLSACLAVFGPEGWNEFSGGVFSGLVISLLLPTSSWKFAQPIVSQPSDRSASTEIFRRAAIPFVVWLVVSPATPRSNAQPAATSSEEAGGQRAKRYRVLMPVDQNQQPSEKLPIVYVSSDLNAALNAAPRSEASDPDQLIASSEYLLYQDQNRRQMLRIQYDIACLNGDSQRALQVPVAPVWRRNLEACFVDGKAQAATTARDENFLLVPVAADSGSQTGLNRHVVRLEIPLPQSMNPHMGELRGALFPVLNSRLSWQSPEALGHVQMPSTRGSLSISLDRRLLEAQLGAVSELSLRQTAAESSAGGDGRTELHLLQILTLRPMLTQVTFRIECRVLEGTVNRLEADLPPGGVLRDLRTHKELQTTVVPRPDGGAKAVIEFSEAQKQDFVVEGEYVLPRSSMDEAVELPRLQVRSGLSAPVKQSVAVACAPEFTAQLINLDDPAVLPILVDAFFTQWGDTFPNQRPQFAFQVQEGGRPSFRLSPVQPDQQVLNWHENVTLSRKGLDWELRAEMKSSAWPVHSFTVLLDRRLTLDAVSVTDDGVDLLARSTKTPMIGSSQNRLTMFLNREATGTCQIRIHGSIRFRPTSSMMLPTVRFETPQSAPGTLALYHETGYRLQLDGKPVELTTPVPTGWMLPEQPHLPLFKQFRLTEGDTGLTVRLEPVSGGCTVQTLWLVDAAATNWRVRGWMELTPEDGTREVRVILPDWLRQSEVAAVLGESPPQQEIRDGQSVLTVFCSGRESEPQLLQWEAFVPATGQSAASLKLPTVPQASQQQDLAAFVSTDGWNVAGGAVVGVNEMPAVVREQLTQWQAESIDTLTQLSNHTLVVRRVDAKSPDGRSSVVLVEHRLRETLDATWSGESTFYPSESAGAVAVLLPQGLEIIALLADRTLVPLSELSADGELWNIADAGRFHRLTVRWKTPVASQPRLFAGRMALPLPECRQERRPTTFVAIHSQQSPWLIFPRNLERRSRASLAIETLEIEIQRYRNATDAGEADSAAEHRIWRLYRAAADELAEAKSIELLRDEELNRWEATVQFVNQIPQTSMTSDDLKLPGDLEVKSFDDADTVFGVLAGDPAELNYWLTRRSLAVGMAAVVLLLASVWLLPKVANWLLSPGWKSRRHASWLLLGAVWWICWSPKVVAVAMMAWAIAEWLQKRRTRLAIAGQ